MHVGLNLLYLLPGIVGGTETYARSLIAELSELSELSAASTTDADRYTVFVNRESAELPLGDLPGVEVVVCDVEATGRGARYAFEQFRLPRLVRSHGIDVLHSLGYVGPWYPGVPHVVTVHDLIHVGFREHLPRGKRLVLQVMVRGVVRRADRVITVSENSRRQILGDVDVPAERVVVVHEAPRPDLIEQLAAPPDVRAAVRARVADRYGIDGPYLLSFSSASPSKNIPAWLDAFATLRDLDRRLVLVGHLPADGEIAARLRSLGLTDRVVVTGYVPDADVVPLLAGADLFVFPSLYEGFGLPVLDAQALGVPVACSSAASLPEVAGEGAALFDPGSPDDMATVVRRLLSNPAARDELVARGRANAAGYSWRRAAEETRAVYRSVGAPEGRS